MSVSNRHKILLFVLMLGTSFLTFCNLAQAQKSLDATNDEQIVIAFYKTGKSVPNFSRWIKKTEPYIHTPWAMRDEVHEEELYRLELAYQTYNPKKDHIIVRTKVNVEPVQKTLKTIKDGEKTKEQTYEIKSSFSNAPDALYFPYEHLEERIVVMPYHLENTMNQQINKSDYDFIDKKTNPADELTAIFRMEPFFADLSQPYQIDGLEQWVLTTKIISVEYWNNKNELIWEHTVPWYESENTIDIKNLYKERPQDSKFKKGRVKPVGPLK